ncbi:hypothetical protein EJB05_34564 [Eragrostis curvula]|uniref:Uncharacterized protein n=1 Tax=Eragrostis curvula TaxID=38414 RepID=A0A5J9U416_9POAL|nr:hypothetical protein EJB05_34564 [Eragrostis curvula]
MVNETHHFDQASLPEYRRWFQQKGMYTVFLDARSLGGLREPIPYPRDDNDWTGYMPSGPPLSRLALRSIKQAAWGIKCALSRGWRKMGKILIMTCYNNVNDINMEEKLKSMLHEAGLPICVDDIRSEDSASAFSTPEPARPTDMNTDVIDDWLYSNRGFTKYLNAGNLNALSIEGPDTNN